MVNKGEKGGYTGRDSRGEGRREEECIGGWVAREEKGHVEEKVHWENENFNKNKNNPTGNGVDCSGSAGFPPPNLCRLHAFRPLPPQPQIFRH